MADSCLIKIMLVFEAGARLGCDSELTCLAARLFHRYSKHQLTDPSRVDLYALSGACLRLAHWHLGKKLDIIDLVLVIADVAKIQDDLITESTKKKLARAIEVLATAVMVNLRFEVNFKDQRATTPGELSKAFKATYSEDPYPLRREQDNFEHAFEIVDDPDELLMLKFSKDLISPQKYLAHYLYSINLLIDKRDERAVLLFKRICNLGWTLLIDSHWNPRVLNVSCSHLACSCLMVAIETFREDLKIHTEPLNQGTMPLLQILDRKWNLILCDDLSDLVLKRIVHVIFQMYNEYDQVFEQELNTHLPNL